MIADGFRHAFRLVGFFAVGAVVTLAMVWSARIAVSHELRRPPAYEPPRLADPVVYVARDGYMHAAVLVATPDAEHWNLVAWTADGSPYTVHGVVEGEPGVPETFHRRDR